MTESKAGRSVRRRIALGAVAVLGATAAAGTAGAATRSDTAQAAVTGAGTTVGKIADALHGGPAEIAKHATILDWPKDGKGPYPVLRKGANGWSCFPTDPAVPGDHPSCVDANGLAWLDAYYAGTTPHLRGVGIWYWPLGSADASNTDPLATKPAPGQNWVIDGPHLAILPADPGTADAYTGYGTHHHGAAPALMFPGTPYVHVHVPLH